MNHNLPNFATRAIMEARGKVTKCETCGLRSTKLTQDCPGGPPHRLWVTMFGEDLCDYVDGQWIDWTGRPVDKPEELRQRSADYLRNQRSKFDKSARRPELRDKMEMEDALLDDDRFNRWNWDIRDLFG